MGSLGIKSAILAPLVVAVALLTGAFTGAAYFQMRDSLQEDTSRRISHGDQLYRLEVQRDATTMAASLVGMSGIPELRNAFIARDRAYLQAVAKPLFDHLRAHYQITSFYFADFRGTVFLRVHQPDSYGDTADDFAIQAATATGGASHGMEVGADGALTLRTVVPWRVGNQLIGFMELGMDSDHIVGNVNRFLDIDLAILLDKTQISRDAWEKRNRTLGQESPWDRLSARVVYGTMPHPIPESLIRLIDTSGVSGAREADDGRDYRFSLYPLQDAASRRIGDIMVYADVTSGIQRFSGTMAMMAVAALAVGAVLVLFFNTILNRIERRLAAADRDTRKALREALFANRSKTEFLANMSHELRTPLNAIIGFSDVMQTKLFGALGHEKYGEYVVNIHDSGLHLLDLINDILDLSKIEAGKLKLNDDVVSLPTVVAAAERLVRERAMEAGITLTSLVRETVPLLRADERRVKQVLLNLLSNAVKFTPQGGTITIDAGLTVDNGLWLAIADTGIGIAPQDIDKAMAPFQQVDGALDRKHEGTGLGLPLCRNLMEVHGGSLVLKSVPGKGTVVTVTFPPERVVRGEPVRL